jgi:Domain of unknown function (DUF4407)
VVWPPCQANYFNQIFIKMRNWWLKFGCFLTGYNYGIMKLSSEASSKAVKRYTSAILIIGLVWGFIGFAFSNRYLRLNILGSLIGAAVMVFIVIQIEKQIILTVEKNISALILRGGIAIIMAILGSVIIDQIIFKEDIEIQQELVINQKVNKILPEKLTEINNEIGRLDSLFAEKNIERIRVIEEITKNPIIKMPGFVTKKIPGKTNKQKIDPLTGESTIIEVDTILIQREYSSTSKENPRAALIPQIDNQINELSIKRDEYNYLRIGIRTKLEKDLKGKVGFLDELKTMKILLSESWIAFSVWILWFLFFLFIELFVVISKFSKNGETDYDVTILHQRNVRIDAINELTKGSNRN